MYRKVSIPPPAPNHSGCLEMFCAHDPVFYFPGAVDYVLIADEINISHKFHSLATKKYQFNKLIIK